MPVAVPVECASLVPCIGTNTQRVVRCLERCVLVRGAKRCACARHCRARARLQPHLNHTSTTNQPLLPAPNSRTQGRTHPWRGRDAAPQGQAKRQSASGCPAAPWGGGRGRGALLSEAHYASTGQRHPNPTAQGGSKEGPPPAAHRLQNRSNTTIYKKVDVYTFENKSRGVRGGSAASMTKKSEPPHR